MWSSTCWSQAIFRTHGLPPMNSLIPLQLTVSIIRTIMTIIIIMMMILIMVLMMILIMIMPVILMMIMSMILMMI